MYPVEYDFAAAERAERKRKDDLILALTAATAAIAPAQRTAKAMAEVSLEVCREHCTASGDDPDFEVFMKGPEESKDFFGGTPGIYIVSWESGPYMWGIDASMAITVENHKLVETHYGFDLLFYPQED